jgi:hypothetical protein
MDHFTNVGTGGCPLPEVFEQIAVWAAGHG